MLFILLGNRENPGNGKNGARNGESGGPPPNFDGYQGLVQSLFRSLGYSLLGLVHEAIGCAVRKKLTLSYGRGNKLCFFLLSHSFTAQQMRWNSEQVRVVVNELFFLAL